MGISFDRVSKRYGPLFALRNITLTIAPSEFVALLGPNGSGKSTLIKVAAQAARPSAGTVSFHLKDDRRIEEAAEARARTGLVGHSSLVYDELTAMENLEFFGKLYGVENIEARAKQLVEAVGLGKRADSLVRTFSRGMRQRLSIARALLHSPGLLLLDEPTTGLDQNALDWLTQCLRELHGAGCTIVMSTHGASDVLEMATRRVTLGAGQISGEVRA